MGNFKLLTITLVFVDFSYFPMPLKNKIMGTSLVKNLPANAGDTGSSPGPGRSHMLRSN